MAEQNGRFTASSTADLEKLTDLIHKLLNIAWGENWGVFSEESPTDNAAEQHRLPHITYSLVSRKKAANMGVKHQTFAAFPDPDHEGETITPQRTWFDCKLEFCIYANTNKESRIWAQRFEEFMETYKGYFKQEGVSEILFEEELIPMMNTSYRQDLPRRTIMYFVRIERITEIRSFELSQVDTVINEPEQRPLVPLGSIQTNVKTHLGNNFLDLYNENFPR